MTYRQNRVVSLDDLQTAPVSLYYLQTVRVFSLDYLQTTRVVSLDYLQTVCMVSLDHQQTESCFQS